MKRLKKWLAVGLPLVCFIVLALFLLSKWSNGVANGTVTTGPTKHATQPAPAAAPLEVKTSLFATTLPSGFVFKDASPPTADLPVRLLASNRQSRQQVGFTGGKLPNDGLQGVADYHLRTSDTVTYHQSPSAGLPAGSSALEDTTGSMVTLFWPHGSQYAEVTVSGDPGTAPDLYDLLYKILQVWHWL